MIEDNNSCQSNMKVDVDIFVMDLVLDNCVTLVWSWCFYLKTTTKLPMVWTYNQIKRQSWNDWFFSSQHLSEISSHSTAYHKITSKFIRKKNTNYHSADGHNSLIHVYFVFALKGNMKYANRSSRDLNW